MFWATDLSVNLQNKQRPWEFEIIYLFSHSFIHAQGKFENRDLKLRDEKKLRGEVSSVRKIRLVHCGS